MTSARTIKRYRQVFRNGRVVRLHRVRAEAALGRPLPVGAVVHHVDGKADDSPLVILQSAQEHTALHRRLRVLRAGGNPFTDYLCSECKRPLPLEMFRVTERVSRQCRPCEIAMRARWVAKHRAHYNAYMRQYRAKKKD